MYHARRQVIGQGDGNVACYNLARSVIFDAGGFFSPATGYPYLAIVA